MRAPAPMVIHAGRRLRTYRVTAQAAAATIQNSPRNPARETSLDSSPAGSASSMASRKAGFHSTTLASLTASIHFSWLRRAPFASLE